MNALDFKETQFKPFWNHILAKLDELKEELKTKDLNTNQRITQELKDMYLKQNEENVNAIQLIRNEMIKQNQKITKDIEDSKSLNLTTFDQHLQQINTLKNEFDEFKTLQNKLTFDQNKSISRLKTSRDKIESNIDKLSKKFSDHSSNADQKLTLFSNEIKELSKLQKENKDDISAWSN